MQTWLKVLIAIFVCLVVLQLVAGVQIMNWFKSMFGKAKKDIENEEGK